MTSEAWTRGGQTAYFEVDDDGIVRVSVEVLQKMLTDLGFEPVHDDQS